MIGPRLRKTAREERAPPRFFWQSTALWDRDTAIDLEPLQGSELLVGLAENPTTWYARCTLGIVEDDPIRWLTLVHTAKLLDMAV